jgi:ribosomal protein S18 acetylase RimI-like enzyme
MNEKIKIRAYKSVDKPKLLEILKLNVPEYFAESEINDLDEYLDHKIEKYFVAEIDDMIIGAGGINFENDFKTGKISWDFIHPEFQGIGVGRKLLNHRLDILKSMKNVETISVRTSQLAYKFYEKNGFVLLEKIKDYWAEGFDMYRMTYE